MNNSIKISIIIPVYNVEKYLRECLESIVNQVNDDVEIICINDGSTDNCLAILNSYAERHNNIIIIDQENKGQGMARNKGLDIAKGEYIMFVDSDDTIEQNTIYNLYSFAKLNDFDLVTFDMYSTDEFLTSKNKCIRALSNTICYKEELLKDNMVSSLAINLYNSSLFAYYRFLPIWYEDMALIPVIISYAQKIGYYKYPAYNYRKRPNSTTRSINDTRNKGAITAWKFILNNINRVYKKNALPLVKNYILNHIKLIPDFTDDYLIFYNENIARHDLFVNSENIPDIYHKSQFKEYIDVNHEEYYKNKELIIWDENNCDVYEAPVTQQAVILKKYTVISEYFKVKALYNNGGHSSFTMTNGNKLQVGASVKNDTIFKIYNKFLTENIISLKGEVKDSITFEKILVNTFIENEYPIYFYNNEQKISGLMIKRL